jgi:multiple sugar transport system substrate-binding protein
VARQAYKGGFFLGDPVYDVLDEAAKRVPDWTWGPNALRLFSTISDNFGPVRGGGTTLPEALKKIQQQAVADMRAKGLSVREGKAA